MSEAVDKVEDAAKGATKGVKGFLGKKVGPLPLGLWIVGVGGGLVIAVWVRNRSANGAGAYDDTAEAAAWDESLGSGWDQTDPGGTRGGVGGGFGDDDDDSYPEDDPTPEVPGGDTDGDDGGGGRRGNGWHARNAKNNAAWRRYAVARMAELGYNPTVTARILAAYLRGEKLTPAERAIRAAVFARAGAPPKPPEKRPESDGDHGGGGNGGGNNGGGGKGNRKDQGKGTRRPGGRDGASIVVGGNLGGGGKRDDKRDDKRKPKPSTADIGKRHTPPNKRKGPSIIRGGRR